MEVAVVGAGLSGLTSIKGCLEQKLLPTCFEMTDSIGGVWTYREEVYPGVGSVTSTTITNTSKEAMAFSDFPMPAEWPTYLSHEKVKEYLDMYADEFNLRKYVKLKHKVISVKQTEDHSDTGHWIVQYQDLQTGRTYNHVFDAVMICSGIFSDPNIPKYPGLSDFRGEIFHSQQFRTAAPFIDKKVLVIGNGNTACDIVCDIAAVTDKPVYLSAREGNWIIERDSENPGDLVSSSLFVRLFMYYLPALFNYFFSRKLLSEFNYEKYNIYPKQPISIDHLVVNNRLIPALKNKTVQGTKAVLRFTHDGVQLVDGSFLQVDAVLMGTGYRVRLPFLSTSLVNPDDWHIYKRVWPVNLAKNTLALVGFIRQTGPILPSVELQARWAAKVFTGKANLASSSVMASHSLHYTKGESKRLSTLLYEDLVFYPTEVAKMIGCAPPMWLLFFTRPWQWLTHLFKPRVPYVYRLRGEGKWSGAQEAINTVWNRLRSN